MSCLERNSCDDHSVSVLECRGRVSRLERHSCDCSVSVLGRRGLPGAAVQPHDAGRVLRARGCAVQSGAALPRGKRRQDKMRSLHVQVNEARPGMVLVEKREGL